jgi:hypothetical protein
MPEHAPFELPEFTRSLRAFAAVGSLGNPDHDRWFAPLLAARTSAARVQGIEGRVAAFDAARLRKAMLNAITQMSEARFKKSAPDRRALDALLEELCEPAFTALVGVEKAAGGRRLCSRSSMPQTDRGVRCSQRCASTPSKAFAQLAAHAAVTSRSSCSLRSRSAEQRSAPTRSM